MSDKWVKLLIFSRTHRSFWSLRTWREISQGSGDPGLALQSHVIRSAVTPNIPFPWARPPDSVLYLLVLLLEPYTDSQPELGWFGYDSAFWYQLQLSNRIKPKSWKNIKFSLFEDGSCPWKALKNNIAVVLTTYWKTFRTLCIWLEKLYMPEKSLIGSRSSFRPQPIIWWWFCTQTIPSRLD